MEHVVCLIALGASKYDISSESPRKPALIKIFTEIFQFVSSYVIRMIAA